MSTRKKKKAAEPLRYCNKKNTHNLLLHWKCHCSFEVFFFLATLSCKHDAFIMFIQKA